MLILYSLVTFCFNFFYDAIFDRLGSVYYWVYTFIEYICFAFILWCHITNTKFRLFILISSLAFITFQVVYFINTGNEVDSISIGVETILVLIYIFYFFYTQLKASIPTLSLYQQSIFWWAIGIMIYLSGAFFFNILVNHMEKAQIQEYWFITYIFDIVKNIFFSIGIFAMANYQKTHSNSHKNIPNLDFN